MKITRHADIRFAKNTPYGPDRWVMKLWQDRLIGTYFWPDWNDCINVALNWCYPDCRETNAPTNAIDSYE